MPESLSTAVLETCPRCDYSLESMPVECRCPECGLTLDRRWRVVAPARTSGWVRRRRAVPILICAACTYALIIKVLSDLGPRSPLGLAMMCAVFGVTLALCVIAWHLLFRRPPGFLAAGPEGLIAFGGRPPCEVYAWSRIREVRPDRWRTGIILELDTDTARLPWRTFFHGDSKEVFRCIEAIEEQRRNFNRHEQLKVPGFDRPKGA